MMENVIITSVMMDIYHTVLMEVVNVQVGIYPLRQFIITKLTLENDKVTNRPIH